MDDDTISEREFHRRKRKPYRVRLPVGVSVLITLVVLIAATVALQPKKPTSHE